MPSSVGRPNSDVSTRVIETLADAADADPLDLPPLYRTIDPDALDSFVTSLDDTAGNHSASIEFRYADYRVAIASDGDVTVTTIE